jgi:hypothetical protein
VGLADRSISGFVFSSILAYASLRVFGTNVSMNIWRTGKIPDSYFLEFGKIGAQKGILPIIAFRK